MLPSATSVLLRNHLPVDSCDSGILLSTHLGSVLGSSLKQNISAYVACRALLRRYPDFPDMRAALAAADWSIGKLGDAESNYQRLNDPRYRDREWLKVNRRWPPKLLSAWEAFLDIKRVAVS